MINKKYTMVLVLMVLLVGTFVSAKVISEEDKLNWKSTKLSIKDDGVYAENIKIKEKERSEIWIDKKIEKQKNGYESFEYHVDSLVLEDTNVKLYLFYNIQPDEINYVSHTGKYKQVYTYNDWIWEDKTECGEEEYCGGYVILDTILEYGTGSNTYTSAISGATWMNDGVSVTLTEGVDYSLGTTSGLLTILNTNYLFSYLTINWDYDVAAVESDSIDTIKSNFISGIDNVSSKVPLIFSIVSAVIIMGIIVLLYFIYQKIKGGEGI